MHTEFRSLEAARNSNSGYTVLRGCERVLRARIRHIKPSTFGSFLKVPCSFQSFQGVLYGACPMGTVLRGHVLPP